MIADWVFTISAAVIQLITSLYMVFDQAYEFRERWIYWDLILYFLVGVCWLLVVWVQIKMRDVAKVALETDTEVPPLY